MNTTTSMNPLVQSCWEQTRDRLQSEVAAYTDVTCRIPSWDPVSLENGLCWLQSSIYEGFYVDYVVRVCDDKATVWFKIWEFGESEPDWDSVIEG